MLPPSPPPAPQPRPNPKIVKKHTVCHNGRTKKGVKKKQTIELGVCEKNLAKKR